MDLLKCCQPIQKKVLTLLIHHHRGFGQLKGLVYDGVTKQVINGAKVKLTVDGISLPGTTVKSTTNGLYETDVVPTGSGYLLEIEADGYISERVFMLTVPDGQAEEVKAVNLVPTAFQGMGKISGIARNTVDNTVIPMLAVILMLGVK